MGKGKIAVVGANQGALAFACFAAEKGFEVSVYEKEQSQNVGHPWADDMIAATFEEIGLSRPPKVIEGKKPPTTLVSPNMKGCITIPDVDRETDIPVDRRQLDQMLAERAVKAGAVIHYGAEAVRAVVSGRRVTGIELESGEKITADLTVDCGGAESRVRRSLPDALHIPREISPEDMFFVRRTYFNRVQGSPAPDKLRKIYLKHLNERGLSWCWLSLDGLYADVLIGRVGELTDETYEKALDDLRRHNDIIGDAAAKGGDLLKIPVRHTISRMFAEGYALVGDSAYMTIPMIGSGMANSMKAAKILSDVISAPVSRPFSTENLYNYQKKYMKDIGLGLAGIELIKNYFLNSEGDEVDFLLSGDVISDSLLQATSGEMSGIPAKEILHTVGRLLSRPSLTADLVKIIASIAAISASKMPEKYNEPDLCKWQEKYDGRFCSTAEQIKRLIR
ncbi:MAG: NAD(P)/FAD-dependent oxidoreductase [Clostridiales bacterium]|nr:NAD(P)/FAD-dependent oxidoreductase [Clostridiales bacterium]